MSTKKIAMLGMLTALYVVLSAFLKFTIFSNIMVDLGYLVYTFALCLFGYYGIIVGVLGCALESILFSAYGFSISWVAANLVIGILCAAILHRKDEHLWLKILVIVISVAFGMIVVKTCIECPLYKIPPAVKLPKNAVAFGVDTVAMLIGLFFYQLVHKRIERFVE